MVISFLPYPDFEKSAKCLDNMRLGKMRSENYIILQRILFLSPPPEEGNPPAPPREEKDKIEGWLTHPMVKSWLGYPLALKAYLNAIITEWESRGFSNSFEKYQLPDEIPLPPFIGLMEFHFSHQASLKRKHPYYYNFPDLPKKYNSLGYLWPSSLTPEKIEQMKREESWRRPRPSLFAPINESYVLSAEKSEERTYTLKQLKELADSFNIPIKNKKKGEILAELKERGILKNLKR